MARCVSGCWLAATVGHSIAPALTPSCGALASGHLSIIATKLPVIRGCSPISCRVVITNSAIIEILNIQAGCAKHTYLTLFNRSWHI